MRRRWILAAMALAMALAPVRQAQAQLGAKVAGGVTVPLGNTSDAQDLGWHAGAGVLFAIPMFPQLMFNTTGGIHRFPGATVGGFEGPALRILDAQLNATYRLLTGGLGQLRPFVTAGGGIFNSKAVGDRAPASAPSSTDFGFNAGLGVEFRFAGVAMFAEGRYTDVFTEGENLTYIPVSVGVMLGGR
jgi:Outer membrane protein beta-barrel domain